MSLLWGPARTINGQAGPTDEWLSVNGVDFRERDDGRSSRLATPSKSKASTPSSAGTSDNTTKRPPSALASRCLDVILAAPGA